MSNWMDHLEEAYTDRRRMEWLSQGNHADMLHNDAEGGFFLEGFSMGTKPTIREAIDEAMKKHTHAPGLNNEH